VRAVGQIAFGGGVRELTCRALRQKKQAGIQAGLFVEVWRSSLTRYPGRQLAYLLFVYLSTEGAFSRSRSKFSAMVSVS